MEELIEILMDIDPDVDYETCDTLVEDGILTSFEMVMLVTEINQRILRTLFRRTLPRRRRFMN